MSNVDPYAEFASGGAPTAKFETIGRTVKGTFVSLDYRQQLDFVTKKPAVWDDGNPKMQYVITLDTDERDPDLTEDDGRRCMYAKKGGSMHKAILAACKAAGVSAPEPGGTLAVQYKSDGPPPKPGLNNEKLFVAKYQRPTADLGAASGQAAVADDLF